MKAVVFHGPFDVKVEDRPKPEIQDSKDAIVKVLTAGLCGSELHMYRGHQKTNSGHIMGHEFVGLIEAVGSEVQTHKVGDKVVSVFATICQTCWFCKRGLSQRCTQSCAFGTQVLDGGQAEYVRVPLADGTLHHAPAHLEDRLLIMMCDIFPTGYYGAMRAVEGIRRPLLDPSTDLRNGNGHQAGEGFVPQSLDEAVFVVLGCGPVGICALMSLRTKGVQKVYAVDEVDDRLAEAKALGALTLKLGKDDVPQTILEATEGRGADAVVEVVGNKAALRAAFDLTRQCGFVSSIGFHQGEVPFLASECYAKNITINFGRAPITTVFPEALHCLEQNRTAAAAFVSHEMPMSEAPHGYDLFEKHQARKVVFKV